MKKKKKLELINYVLYVEQNCILVIEVINGFLRERESERKTFHKPMKLEKSCNILTRAISNSCVNRYISEIAEHCMYKIYDVPLYRYPWYNSVIIPCRYLRDDNCLLHFDRALLRIYFIHEMSKHFCYPAL